MENWADGVEVKRESRERRELERVVGDDRRSVERGAGMGGQDPRNSTTAVTEKTSEDSMSDSKGQGRS